MKPEFQFETFIQWTWDPCPHCVPLSSGVLGSSACELREKMRHVGLDWQLLMPGNQRADHTNLHCIGWWNHNTHQWPSATAFSVSSSPQFSGIPEQWVTSPDHWNVWSFESPEKSAATSAFLKSWEILQVPVVGCSAFSPGGRMLPQMLPPH